LETPLKKNYVVPVRSYNKISPSSNPRGMYTRIVSIKIQPGKIEEFKNLYSAEIIPVIESMQGCIFAYLLEGLKDENEFLSISAWEDKSFVDEYEAKGKFTFLISKVKHTFSKFYLWKMELEQNKKGKVETSEDMKIDNYTMVTGKNFE